MSIFSKKIGKDLQLSFFDEIGSAQPLRQLFEHLPGVFFFLKDRCSRMMGASSKLYERLGCASEEEMVGATDYDFFPNQIADGFVRDDQQVMKTGESLINRVEIWYNEQRLLDWFMTTKLPVRNVKGEVIGLMGTVRRMEQVTDYYGRKYITVIVNTSYSRALSHYFRNFDPKSSKPFSQHSSS